MYCLGPIQTCEPKEDETNEKEVKDNTPSMEDLVESLEDMYKSLKKMSKEKLKLTNELNYEKLTHENNLKELELKTNC